MKPLFALFLSFVSFTSTAQAYHFVPSEVHAIRCEHQNGIFGEPHFVDISFSKNGILTTDYDMVEVNHSALRRFAPDFVGAYTLDDEAQTITGIKNENSQIVITIDFKNLSCEVNYNGAYRTLKGKIEGVDNCGTSLWDNPEERKFCTSL
jgi:hypothetical protein